MKGARVVAWADRTPAALVVSALAFRQLVGADVKVTYGVLASGLRLDIVEGVKRLLEDRGVVFDVTADPGWERTEERERGVAALLEEASRDATCTLALDISGAGPEAATVSLDLARKAWRRPFQVVSFDAGRGTVRIARDPAPRRGLAVQFARFDAGDPADTAPLHAAPVGPGDLLGLYGLRLIPEDPYGLTGGNTPGTDEILWKASCRILDTAVTSPARFTRFRAALAALSHALPPEGGEAALEGRDLPEGILPAMEAMQRLGLASPRGGGTGWILRGAHDRGAVFFLRGGWLEIVVAGVLSRSFDTPRPVERNAGTLWGRTRTNSSPYAEADAVFTLKNRLFVISCKNDFVDDNLLRHADRLRALAAEYGETSVSPVLVSTRAVEGALEKRCRAYEIGHVSGPGLLSILLEDSASESPRKLLDAIWAACSGPPMPGTNTV